MYIACGSNEMPPGSAVYQIIFINDGTDILQKMFWRFRKIYQQIRGTGFDFDKDGDADLFIGGRISLNYPHAVSSMLLRNDSRNGM